MSHESINLYGTYKPRMEPELGLARSCASICMEHDDKIPVQEVFMRGNGRQNIGSKIANTVNPGSVNMIPVMVKETMKILLRIWIFRWGDYPGISCGPNLCTCVLKSNFPICGQSGV